MAKAKKKRTKKYRPRALKLPPMVLDCWDPLSDKDRADLDLAGFLPLAAIRSGEGTIDNCQNVCLAIQSGYIAALRFGEEWRVKALMLIAYCGVQLAAEFIKQGKPVEPWMLDPAQAALEVVADMEAQCSRRELCENIQETFRNVHRICKFEPEALWVVTPEQAMCSDDGEVKGLDYLEGRRALTFMHGSPIIGYVVRDGERVIWREPSTETNLPITSPVLCLLADPEENPWYWREGDSND